MDYKRPKQESETVEFKKSTSELKQGVISIASILNKHGGGELYFGITNNGTLTGSPISDSTYRDVSRAIAEGIEPRIFPTVSREKENGKEYIRVLFSGVDSPYLAFGRAFIRTGEEDRKLSKSDLEAMILAKNKSRLRWDWSINQEATQQNLSEEKINNFQKQAGLPTGVFDDVLEKLGLTVGTKVRNAALLFFAQDPIHFVPGLKLRCARFSGTTTANIIGGYY